MISTTIEGARTRIKTIRAQRSARALIGLLIALTTSQLLFVSFTLGYWLGPSRLPAREVFVGVTATLILGIVVAILFGRGRLERGSRWAGVLREGQRSRRVAIFADYVTIDREILVRDTVERAEIDGEALVLRYVDPVADGPVLRELTGPRADLKRLAEMLAPAESSAPA